MAKRYFKLNQREQRSAKVIAANARFELEKQYVVNELREHDNPVMRECAEYIDGGFQDVDNLAKWMKENPEAAAEVNFLITMVQHMDFSDETI